MAATIKLSYDLLVRDFVRYLEEDITTLRRLQRDSQNSQDTVQKLKKENRQLKERINKMLSKQDGVFV